MPSVAAKTSRTHVVARRRTVLASQRVTRAIQKDRAKKCAARQQDLRRRRLMEEIAVFCTVEGRGVYDILSAREAAGIQEADLYRARKIFRRVTGRLQKKGVAAISPAIVSVQLVLANRPITALSRQNRSSINPELSFACLGEEATGTDQRPILAERSARAPIANLGRAAHSQAEESRRSIGSKKTDAVEASAFFWCCYREGRLRYESSYPGNGLEEYAIALFNHEQLRQLLPGIIVPRVHLRAHYLASLLYERNRLCLDAFAGGSLRPLFRHYF